MVSQNFLLSAILFTLRLLQESVLDFLSYYLILPKNLFPFYKKEIFSTFVFPIFVKETSSSYNLFFEVFIHKGRLALSNKFFRHWVMNIKTKHIEIFEIPLAEYLKEMTFVEYLLYEVFLDWFKKTLSWLILGLCFACMKYF